MSILCVEGKFLSWNNSAPTGRLFMKTDVWLYYIRKQHDATLAVLFINNYKNTLHVSDVHRVHHQEYINCSSSHWCMSWVGMLYMLLQFMYSWWWTRWTSETCRVFLQLLINNTAKVASSCFLIWYRLMMQGNSNTKLMFDYFPRFTEIW